MLRARPGATLVELSIALSLLGIVLGAFLLLGLRQEENHRSLAMRNRARAQLREAAAGLPQELRGLSPTGGDIARGGARDSTLEFRATIVAGVVCRTSDNMVELPRGGETWPMVAVLAAPEPGDSLWIHEPPADREGTPLDPPALEELPAGGWRGRAVRAVSRSSSSCGIFEPDGASGTRFLLQLDADPQGVVPRLGSAFRVTRPARYSIYRSSADGGWYLGMRDWNNSLGRFDAVQPIAGPFTPPRGGGERSMFRYYDAAGEELPSGTTETERIARVTLGLCAEEKLRRSPPQAYRPPCEGDDATMSIAMRDRPMSAR
jgi:hypothetical protein